MAHDNIAEAKCHIPDGFFDVWNIILRDAGTDFLQARPTVSSKAFKMITT